MTRSRNNDPVAITRFVGMDGGGGIEREKGGWSFVERGLECTGFGGCKTLVGERY